MNQSVMQRAVSAGWISYPTQTTPTVKRRVVSTAEQFNARRAWKLWNSGNSIDYVAKAVGVKKRAVKALIEEGKP